MSVKQKEIDHGWAKILKEHKINEIKIKVGLFGEGSDPKNNMAYLGLIHQMGAEIKVTPKMKGYFAAVFHIRKSDRPIIIPKRPFMSNAFDTDERNLSNFVRREYTKVVDGKQTIKIMIDRIGVRHVGTIKKAFTQFDYTPNSFLTKTIKGSSRPLIDNGQMRGSVKVEVEIK